MYKVLYDVEVKCKNGLTTPNFAPITDIFHFSIMEIKD